MSSNPDRKTENVVLAQYQYRHEAEFAAGFLDDAEIPYRLQVDDGGMGMTISTPATLWVRGVDLAHARDVLELPEPVVTPRRVTGGGPGAPTRRPDAGAPVISYEDAAVRYGLERTPGRLTGLERTVSLVVFVGCVGGAIAALPTPAGALWAALLAVAAAPFALGALFARTVAPARALLRAISGSAP